jgi:hypothetical protein
MSNLALYKPISALFTTAGATTLGYQTGQTYPSEFIPVSAASAVTLTLPVIALGSSTVGYGQNQVLRVANYAAQAVTVAAASGNAIVGSTATIAQNAVAEFWSDQATGTIWYRT